MSTDVTQIENFELVFQGLNDESEQAKRNVQSVLTSRCGFEIVEFDELLSGGATTVKRTSDRMEIDSIFQELKNAGGKVLIVKNKLPEVATESDSLTISQRDFKSFFTNYALKLHKVLHSVSSDEVREMAEDFLRARDERKQIFIFGNGGSAAVASHMANDFAKQRFEDEDLLFRVMSLTDNVSWISATANDFGYDYIFVNQLKNLLQPGDVVVAISSSGNSPNIIKAIDYANAKGAITYGIAGFDGGALKTAAQKPIFIPTKKGQYGYMEDVCSIISHIVSVYIYEQDEKRHSANN